MRNFTREGAAVSSGHTQRLEYPYPRHTPRRGGAAAQLAGRAVLRREATRRRARLRGAGLPTTGRRGRGGRLPQTRRLRGARWARLPGAGEYRGGGLPGQTGRFPGQTRRISGRLPGAGLPAARAATCAGAGRIPGRGYPGGRRGSTAYPGRGGYPAAAPPAKITVFRRLVTGSRRTRSLCAFPGGYPGAATRRRGAKKYFFRGAGFCAGIPASRILRAYIEAGRPGGATGILIRQKPPEKLVLFGTCFFRRSE